MYGPVHDPGDLVGWLIVLTAGTLIGVEFVFRLVESVWHD